MKVHLRANLLSTEHLFARLARLSPLFLCLSRHRVSKSKGKNEHHKG